MFYTDSIAFMYAELVEFCARFQLIITFLEIKKKFTWIKFINLFFILLLFFSQFFFYIFFNFFVLATFQVGNEFSDLRKIFTGLFTFWKSVIFFVKFYNKFSFVFCFRIKKNIVCFTYFIDDLSEFLNLVFRWRVIIFPFLVPFLNLVFPFPFCQYVPFQVVPSLSCCNYSEVSLINDPVQ